MHYNRYIAVAVLAGMVSVTVIATERPPEPGSEHGWWRQSGTYEPIIKMNKSEGLHYRGLLDSIMAATGDKWNLEQLARGALWKLEGRSSAPYGHSVEDAAERFLAAYRSIFASEGVRFKQLSVEKTLLGNVSVSFQAYSGDLPIWNGVASITVDEDHRVVTSIWGHLRVSDEIGQILGFNAAVEPLLKYLLPDSGSIRDQTELLIYPSDPARVAYRCTVDVWIRQDDSLWSHGIPSVFLIDASTGNILQVQNIVWSEFPIFPLPGLVTDQSSELGGPDLGEH